MSQEPKPRSPGLHALRDRYIGDDADRLRALNTARTNAEIAGCLYRLRIKAGLTQRDLALVVGTTASVICRLEDADYDGHSLTMLRRVAQALGRSVQIRFVPNPRRASLIKGNARRSKPGEPLKVAITRPKGTRTVGKKPRTDTL